MGRRRPDGRGAGQQRRLRQRRALPASSTASARSRWSSSTWRRSWTSAGACVPEMVARGRGAVLNVASSAAFQPLPRQATYAATKAFVLSFTDALTSDLSGTGVSATALCPGPVKTEFVENAGLDEAEGGVPSMFMWTTAEFNAEEAVKGLESRQARGGAGQVQPRRRARRPARPARAAAQGARPDHARGRVKRVAGPAGRLPRSPPAAAATTSARRPPRPRRGRRHTGHPRPTNAPERAQGRAAGADRRRRPRGPLGPGLPARRPRAGHRAPGPRAAARRGRPLRPEPVAESTWTTRARAASSGSRWTPTSSATGSSTSTAPPTAGTRSPATG